MAHRTYTYRFYPSKKQIEYCSNTFGCCRFVYNYFLNYRLHAWEASGVNVQNYRYLTELKSYEEYSWLRKVPSVALQQSLANLDKAFDNFFSKRSKFPKMKNKNGKQAFRLNGGALAGVTHTQVKLPKDENILNLVWHRPLPKLSRILSLTIKLDSVGRYWAMFLVEENTVAHPLRQNAVGVDVGINTFATLSTGEKILSPKAYKVSQNKLAQLQRRFSKKKKGSKNRNKARLKVARLHAKIANVRKDFAHKLSTRLIRENQTICLESLAVRNMVKNRRLAKSISDASWTSFTNILEYKAAWYGRTIVRINRYEPTSKRCSSCSEVVKLLPLATREWACPSCGVLHDRDVNAAINILAAGLAVAACGETVRPNSCKAKGLGSAKQELPGASG